jgi:predicted acetyltransferase
MSDITLRRLTEGDLDAYLELRETSWGYPAKDPELRPTFLRRLPTIWGAFDGHDALAASLTDHRYEVYVAGVPVPMSGIGAVQTAPEHRRGGLARRLLIQSLERARDEAIGWSVLYPFDPRFYARYGWQSLPSGVELEMPVERLAGTGSAGTGSAGAGAAAAGADEGGVERVRGELREALQGIYQRCAARYAFANTRAHGPWDVWDDLRPQPGERHLAYRFDDGYAIVRTKEEGDPGGPQLRVVDHGAASARGREALRRLLATFVGQASTLRIDVPSDDPWAWEWSGWYARRGRRILMARVADLPAALGRLRAVRSGDGGDEPVELPPFSLRVRDDVAPWNDGAWRIEPGPDGYNVTRASGADTTVDVRGLTLLVGGAASPDAVRYAGLAEGATGPLASLATLSAGRSPYQAAADGF